MPAPERGEIDFEAVMILADHRDCGAAGEVIHPKRSLITQTVDPNAVLSSMRLAASVGEEVLA